MKAHRTGKTVQKTDGHPNYKTPLKRARDDPGACHVFVESVKQAKRCSSRGREGRSVFLCCPEYVSLQLQTFGEFELRGRWFKSQSTQ